MALHDSSEFHNFAYEGRAGSNQVFAAFKFSLGDHSVAGPDGQSEILPVPSPGSRTVFDTITRTRIDIVFGAFSVLFLLFLFLCLQLR